MRSKRIVGHIKGRMDFRGEHQNRCFDLCEQSKRTDARSTRSTTKCTIDANEQKEYYSRKARELNLQEGNKVLLQWNAEEKVSYLAMFGLSA